MITFFVYCGEWDHAGGLILSQADAPQRISQYLNISRNTGVYWSSVSRIAFTEPPPTQRITTCLSVF